MRPSPRSLAVVASVAALLPALMAAPAAAKPTTVLRPGDLPRGADVAIVHLEGKTIVDGDVRVRVKAHTLRLLGKSGSAYVVGTADRRGDHGRIYRVTADGQQTLLAKGDIYQTILSGDGARVVITKVTLSRSRIWAIDATTGGREGVQELKGYAEAVDAQGLQVLIGTPGRTVLWDLLTDDLSVVARDGAYIGDLSADVVGVFTKDPYDGGCAEVRRISTGDRLWRSCTEQVAAFNADATRIATIGILSDGLGPGRVDARTINGKHLGRYQVKSGWFGTVEFETTTALLLEVNAARKAFTARCTGSDCERASRLRPVETPRAS